uniref:Uncharacterized protein n=1 Tax=Romanomermis culicivorax TaxID=13658 RepID=A0A915HJU7_ROMCU
MSDIINNRSARFDVIALVGTASKPREKVATEGIRFCKEGNVKECKNLYNFHSDTADRRSSPFRVDLRLTIGPLYPANNPESSETIKL